MKTERVPGFLIGLVLFLLGLISFLLQAQGFQDWRDSFQMGSGYLFMVSGLVVILIYFLFLFSNQTEEAKEPDRKEEGRIKLG